MEAEPKAKRGDEKCPTIAHSIVHTWSDERGGKIYVKLLDAHPRPNSFTELNDGRFFAANVRCWLNRWRWKLFRMKICRVAEVIVDRSDFSSAKKLVAPTWVEIL
jgi:hypothetical protein